MRTIIFFLITLFSSCGPNHDVENQDHLSEEISDINNNKEKFSFKTEHGDILIQSDSENLFKVCIQDQSKSETCLKVKNELSVPLPIFGCRNVLRKMASYFGIDDVNHYQIDDFDEDAISEKNFQIFCKEKGCSSEFIEGWRQEFKNKELENYMEKSWKKVTDIQNMHSEFSYRLPNVINLSLLLKLVKLDEYSENMKQIDLYNECSYALEEFGADFSFDLLNNPDILKHIEPKRLENINTPFVQKEIHQYLFPMFALHDGLGIKSDHFYMKKIEANLRDRLDIIKLGSGSYLCMKLPE